MINALNPSDDTYYTTLIHVILAYNEKEEIIGGTLFEVFPNSACGLLSYICVQEEYRKAKIGKVLIERASHVMDTDCLKMRGKECFAILFETSSPLKYKSHDSISPISRLQVLKRLGCDLIDFEFIQPPLEPNLGIDTNLVLLYLNRDGKKQLDGNQLLKFMKEYWEVTGAPLDHPYFLNTIKVLKGNSIPVINLSIENIQNIDYCVTGLYPNPLVTTAATNAEMPKKFFHSKL